MTAVSPTLAFKFIIVGSSSVGKTALLKRLVDDSFASESQSTIGVEFESTCMDVEGETIKLQIWDTAGQERFRSIAKAYFRNAVGAILVFDINESSTFEDVSMWLNEIRSLCDPTAVVILVGNKADLSESRAVTMAEAEKFAQHHHITYIETSAKSGENVREAFLRCATLVYRKSPKTVRAVPPQTTNPGPKGCCG
jgi:small GTP-binding protein